MPPCNPVIVVDVTFPLISVVITGPDDGVAVIVYLLIIPREGAVKETFIDVSVILLTTNPLGGGNMVL